MNNYKKWLPVIIFCIAAVLLISAVASIIAPKLTEISYMESKVASQEQELDNLMNHKE